MSKSKVLKLAPPADACADGSPRSASGLRFAMAEGDGSFRLNVVGESKYQNYLDAVVGGRSPEGAEHYCAAALIPQPENLYDPNAVRVMIGRGTVGYLERHHAPGFLRSLNQGGFAAAGCQAVIVGGWDRGDGDVGHYGVRLDVGVPFAFVPIGNRASDVVEYNVAADQDKRTKGGGSRVFIGIGFLLAAAVAALIAHTDKGSKNPIAALAYFGPAVPAPTTPPPAISPASVNNRADSPPPLPRPRPSNRTQVAQTDPGPAAREQFAARYRVSGAMIGSACNKVVVYGSNNNGFSLKCPGISRETARLILADSPIVRELREHGFSYFSIESAGGVSLPEVKLR